MDYINLSFENTNLLRKQFLKNVTKEKKSKILNFINYIYFLIYKILQIQLIELILAQAILNVKIKLFLIFQIYTTEEQ